MWQQQPMLPHGMPPRNTNPIPHPPQDQSAASWGMRAQQWAQQRRVHNTVYPQQPPYPTGPPGERMPPPPPPPAPPQHLPPPGVQTEYMHPPPPPINYPPSHSQDPHYRQYSPVPYSNYSHEHRQPLPPLQQAPFQDPHPKSNPQTGQFESPDEFHLPPHLQQQSHWEHTEEPPHEYSPPSEPTPSPPPPHEYTYRYVPRHHYQQPYGRDRSEERVSPPPQLDNKEIELAAKRLLEDDSDSDSDNDNSNNRRKRVSEEDSLLTRRVYDPNHVYANTPSEQVSRLPQWSDTHPPPPPTQDAPPVHLPAHQEQPPQSFDYGHGFPPPVRYHAPSQPPASYPFPAPEYSPAPAADYTQGEEEWAASRRVIPAWLRDDLKKLERDRQKQIDKESMERNSVHGWKESYDGTEMFGPPIPQHITDKARFFTNEDSRDKFLLEILQMSVTEFLLEMTSAEIENVCSNALAEVRQARAKPMVSYESSTESSLHEDELRDERKVTPINGQRARKSSYSSSPADRYSSRRSKHKSKSSKHHRRSEPSSSSSRSRKHSENSRSYRSRSRSPYSKSNKKHKSRH